MNTMLGLIQTWLYRRREKRKQKFISIWINKQFKIAKHQITFSDLITNSIDDWYNKYTITSEQEEHLKKWSIKKLKKLYPYWTDKQLNKEYSILVLTYGLRTL